MANKENNKNKKSFFKDFKAELKKVNWPTPKQLLNNTTAVITIVIITTAIVCVLDLAFEVLNKQGVEKVKGLITTENTVVDETTNENEAGEEESQDGTTTDTNTTEGTETPSEGEAPVENNTENNSAE